MISRKFGIDYINLGFSGSARGEEIMAEYFDKRFKVIKNTFDKNVYLIDGRYILDLIGEDSGTVET